MWSPQCGARDPGWLSHALLPGPGRPLPADREWTGRAEAVRAHVTVGPDPGETAWFSAPRREAPANRTPGWNRDHESQLHRGSVGSARPGPEALSFPLAAWQELPALSSTPRAHECGCMKGARAGGHTGVGHLLLAN
jgi:hypothetical protein